MKAPRWFREVGTALEEFLAAAEDDKEWIFRRLYNHPKLKAYLMRRIGWRVSRIHLAVGEAWDLKGSIYDDAMLVIWNMRGGKGERTQGKRARRGVQCRPTMLHRRICSIVDKCAQCSVDKERRERKRLPVPLSEERLDREEVGVRQRLVPAERGDVSSLVMARLGGNGTPMDGKIISDRLNDISTRETARELRMKEAAVRKRRSRIMRRLR